MIREVIVPELPESVTDATLMNWNKNIGEYVNVGDNLVSLETDKIVLDLVAPASGVLAEIRVSHGTTVNSGEVVAIIKVQNNKKTETNIKNTTSIENGNKSNQTESTSTPYSKSSSIMSINARYEERIPMTRLRKRIAERLLDAQQHTAMLTTFNEVNMKPIMELRKKSQEQFVAKNGTKLGIMSFFVKAAVAALKSYPIINATSDDEHIIYHNYQDIGVAISSPRGLVVPILRNAETMNFSDIEQNIKAFSVKAKNSTLSIEEISGGTFTITNGGTFGSMFSTPILNPPQSAILGMHNIIERPIAEDGKILIRPMMYLALSYDHRIIDGKEAVSFLVSIKNIIENPALLLLEL